MPNGSLSVWHAPLLRPRRLAQFLKAADVFAEDVVFNVHLRAHPDGVEIGVLEGVGDDADLEGFGCGIADGEADAIDRHAALVNGEITAAGQFGGIAVAEGEDVTAAVLLHAGTFGCVVHVALHDMAIKAAVHQHGALHVDFVAHLQTAKVRAAQGFVHGCDHVGIGFLSYHGEANTVVGYALVNVQFAGKGAAEGEMNIVAVVLNGYDLCGGFYDS